MYYAFQISLWIVFVSSKSWSDRTMLLNSEIMSLNLILSQLCQHLLTQKEMFSKKNTLNINETSEKKKTTLNVNTAVAKKVHWQCGEHMSCASEPIVVLLVVNLD